MTTEFGGDTGVDADYKDTFCYNEWRKVMVQWWQSDDFAFFTDWFMNDMERKQYKWEQIARRMKDLAVTPHKFKADYDRYLDETREYNNE